MFVVSIELIYNKTFITNFFIYYIWFITNKSVQYFRIFKVTKPFLKLLKYQKKSSILFITAIKFAKCDKQAYKLLSFMDIYILTLNFIIQFV